MNTPDDPTQHEPEAEDAPPVPENVISAGPIESEPGERPSTPHSWRPNLRRLAVHLQEISPLAERPTEPMPALAPETPAASSDTGTSAPTHPPLRARSWRFRDRRDKVRDWQNWSQFRLWRHTRPFWGSLCMIAAGSLLIVSASFFLPLAFLAQSLWPAILVGGLLLVMGVIQLLLPTYNVITGSIGIVLALVSLLVASFGGCGVGLLLGIIGSALSIAWRPVKRSRLHAVQTSQTS